MNLKTLLLSLGIYSGLIHTTFSQNEKSGLAPSFSAIIVRNLDTSTKWYSEVLALSTKNHMEDQLGGYRINILGSDSFTLELLELKNSLPSSEYLKNKPEGVKAQGLFKLGFTVKDMDSFVNLLEKMKIDIPQIWTDSQTKKRNFILSDPDGNLIQFFE